MKLTFALIVSIWNTDVQTWDVYVEDSGLGGADCIERVAMYAEFADATGAVVACELESTE